MNEIRAHLDKIRGDAAECVLLSNLVADEKRAVFARAAEHLSALALEVEKTIAATGADAAKSLDAAKSVSAARSPDGDKGSGDSDSAVPPEEPEKAVALESLATHQQPAAQPRKMLPWLSVVVLGGIVGAFFWANYPAEAYRSLLNLPSKHDTPPAVQDETMQAIAALLSGAQADRRTLIEQMSSLAARVDNLATSLDNLKAARADAVVVSSNKASVGPEEKPSAAEVKLTVPEEKSVRKDESRSSVPGGSATAKLSESISAATETPPGEPADRVGTIRSAPRRAEQDSRRASTGPAGCTQFRSFDPVSGMYTTLEGRRRPCRQ
jgi:hypothetical protein